MLREVFSDCFSQRENYLTRIDARIKIFFVFALIMACLCANHCRAPLITAAAAILLLVSIRIPFKVIVIRLLAPFGVVMVVFFLQIFFYGQTPIMQFGILGWHFTAYLEGFQRGLLILSRVTGAVSLVIFLSMATPVNIMLDAARWFKAPAAWVEVSMLTYRYIFVLLEDVLTIRDAQRVRLGYKGVIRSMYSLGELAGAAVIRAYDQSLAVQEAMILRGYKPEVSIATCHKKWRAKDLIAGLIFAVVLVCLVVVDRV